MFARLKNALWLKFFPKQLIKKIESAGAKRIFFLRQYEGTLKRVWGMEFAVEGLKDAREIVRREYDKLNETLDAAKIALTNNVNNPDQSVKEKLEKGIETKAREIEEWKKKIDMSDESIKDTQDQIDAYYEQLPRLKKWI